MSVKHTPHPTPTLLLAFSFVILNYEFIKGWAEFSCLLPDLWEGEKQDPQCLGSRSKRESHARAPSALTSPHCDFRSLDVTFPGL